MREKRVYLQLHELDYNHTKCEIKCEDLRVCSGIEWSERGYNAWHKKYIGKVRTCGESGEWDEQLLSEQAISHNNKVLANTAMSSIGQRHPAVICQLRSRLSD